MSESHSTFGERAATSELLRRVQLRERAAWAVLTDRYAPLVYHWSRSLGASPAEAVPILGHVFRALRAQLGALDPKQEERGLCGWLWDLTVAEIGRFAIRKTDSFADERELHDAVAALRAQDEELSPSGRPGAATPGLTQLRQYQLVAKLGEGGMGEIYKAVHTGLQKVVALKLLVTDRATSQRSLARFHREMLAVGRLDHPNIIRAHDAGEINGTHFLVMEYVEGLDTQRLVDLMGPLPLAEACEIARQAAVGLQHVHEQGLVHRDVKPSNLMVSSDGVVKLLDLGLAMLPDEAAETTDDSRLLGTLDFMAPEQAEYSSDVTIQADIYSLGATLYKILTGRAPLACAEDVTPLQKMLALARKAPPPLELHRPDAPGELAQIVAWMLAGQPDQRPRTSAEAADALGAFTAGSRLAELVADAGRRLEGAIHGDPSGGSTATADPPALC